MITRQNVGYNRDTEVLKKRLSTSETSIESLNPREFAGWKRVQSMEIGKEGFIPSTKDTVKRITGMRKRRLYSWLVELKSLQEQRELQFYERKSQFCLMMTVRLKCQYFAVSGV